MVIYWQRVNVMRRPSKWDKESNLCFPPLQLHTFESKVRLMSAAAPPTDSIFLINFLFYFIETLCYSIILVNTQLAFYYFIILVNTQLPNKF